MSSGHLQWIGRRANAQMHTVEGCVQRGVGHPWRLDAVPRWMPCPEANLLLYTAEACTQWGGLAAWQGVGLAQPLAAHGRRPCAVEMLAKYNEKN